MQGKRSICGIKTKIQPALFMRALVASRYNRIIGDFHKCSHLGTRLGPEVVGD